MELSHCFSEPTYFYLLPGQCRLGVVLTKVDLVIILYLIVTKIFTIKVSPDDHMLCYLPFINNFKQIFYQLGLFSIFYVINMLLCVPLYRFGYVINQ